MARGALTLTQATQPAGTTSLFNAVGTFNLGNNKSRLEAAGQTTLQGGNPGNGWFNNTERSWLLSWNNTTGTVSFNLFSTTDWTGAPANIVLTQTPVLTAGNALLGLDIGARLTSSSQSVTIGSVQFDSGGGFVNVPTANATYSGNAFFNNYHSLVGTLGDFTIRGTAIFPTGTTTGDSMRFFVNGRQRPAPVVPEPSSLLVWSLLALTAGGLGWRRRKRSA